MICIWHQSIHEFQNASEYQVARLSNRIAFLLYRPSARVELSEHSVHLVTSLRTCDLQNASDQLVLLRLHHQQQLENNAFRSSNDGDDDKNSDMDDWL